MVSNPPNSAGPSLLVEGPFRSEYQQLSAGVLIPIGGLSYPSDVMGKLTSRLQMRSL